tara:strand:+ start:667 stop:975 length:309 start_codon:yes stop_codon:yes gene_type:complete
MIPHPFPPLDRDRPANPPPSQRTTNARPGLWQSTGTTRANHAVFGLLTTTDARGQPLQDQIASVRRCDIPDWAAEPGTLAHVSAELVDGRWKISAWDRRSGR